MQAISALMHYRSHWPALIIVPCSLLKQWPDEIKKYTRLQDADICCLSKSSDVFSGGTASLCITTYTIIGSLVGNKALTPEQFGVVIADESHNIKNKDAHRSIAVLPFLRKAQVALCMTGTPAVNRPVELFPQLAALLPEVFCEYLPFVHRYCDAKPTKFGSGLDVSGHSNDAELKILLTGLVMIRRTKNEVLHDLPQKVRELRHVEPDPKYVPEISRINDRSDRIDSKMKEAQGQGDTAELKTLQNEKQTLLNQLYQVTGMAKIPAIKQELLALIEGARQSRHSSCEEQSGAQVAMVSDRGVTVDLSRDDDDDDGDDDDGDDDDATAALSRPSKRGALLSAMGCKVMELEEDIVNEDLTCCPAGRSKPHLSRRSYSSRFVEDDDDDDDDDDSCGDGDSGLDEGEPERGADMPSARSSSSSSSSREEKKSKSFIDLMLGGGGGGGVAMKKKKRSSKITASSKTDARKKAKQCPAPSAADPPPRLGHKIIAFFHHQVVMDALEEALLQMGVQFIRIDGSTTQKHRSRMIAQFQDDNLTYVALLSLTACGTGLNLTRANVALFAELNWSLGTMLQAEDRIHRMGQLAKDVRIIYMIAKDTVDETVWNAVQKKHQVVGATVGTSEGDNASHRGAMKVDSGHRLQRPLASLPSSSSSSSSSSTGRKVLDEAPVQPSVLPTASHQVPIYEFYKRCNGGGGGGSAPAVAGAAVAGAGLKATAATTTTAATAIDPLHRPRPATLVTVTSSSSSSSSSPHHCSTATDPGDGSFNAAESDCCAFVYSVPISLSGGEDPKGPFTSIPIACTAISSHLDQPTVNASRANDGNASRANDGYAGQPPVNASRANDGYAVHPPVNASRANDGYAGQPPVISVICGWELSGDSSVSDRQGGHGSSSSSSSSLSSPSSSAAAVPKPCLGPDVMARIAANRSAALAKLAAKNSHHGHATIPSRDPLLPINNTAPHHHVFSTGKGSAVLVSHEKIVEGSAKLS